MIANTFVTFLREHIADFCRASHRSMSYGAMHPDIAKIGTHTPPRGRCGGTAGVWGPPPHQIRNYCQSTSKAHDEVLENLIVHLSGRCGPSSAGDAVAEPVDHGQVTNQIDEAGHTSSHQGREGVKSRKEVGLGHKDDKLGWDPCTPATQAFSTHSL